MNKLSTPSQNLRNIAALVLFFGCAAVFWGAAILHVIKVNKGINDSDYMVIENVFVGLPTVEIVSKNSPLIRLQLLSYPGCSFLVRGVAFEATSVDAFRINLHYNDSIFVTVHKKDFQKLKTTDLTAHAAWKPCIVDVFAFKDKHMAYLSLEQYAQNAKDNSFVVVTFNVILGLFAFVLAMLLLWTMRIKE
jgi:hypothetical protein